MWLFSGTKQRAGGGKMAPMDGPDLQLRTDEGFIMVARPVR